MRRGLLAAGVLAVLAVAVLGLAGRFGPAGPAAVNGDQLGMAAGEGFDDYRRRAAASLERAPAGEPAWALVTFAGPVDAAAAGRVTADAGRVSAVIPPGAVPVAVPEPVAGGTRGEVFARELARIPYDVADIASVTVYDDPAALDRLAADEAVAAVEVLPPDAAWGRFGVRPVDTRA